jgi:hypothetical protein
MKYLLTLLMLFAPPAWADWDFVVETESGTQVFIDFQTVRKEGNRVKVWQLTNYLKPQKIPSGLEIFSLRTRYEFDCKDETSRMLAITAFPEQYAKGKELGHEGESNKWEHIAPRSTHSEVLKKVCKPPVR